MTVGSLFAGIGGIDLGFKQAGFPISWEIENDPACCRTYRYNFPDALLLEKDIRRVMPRGLHKVDLLVAGFPCQPFSVAGKERGFNDKRGNLFFKIMRFSDHINPTIIFLENVPNLMDHDKGHTFNTIHNALVEKGYFIRYKVLCASEYDGVPQIRDRIYLIAFRNISICDRFKYPGPTKITTDIYSVL